MQVQIEKSQLQGAISAPTSKSMAHRLLICAFLSKGESEISKVTFSADIYATLNCLKKMGADYAIEGDKVKIKGISDISLKIENTFHCGESGSTMRFIIPLLLLSDVKQHITGEGRLMERPQSVYEEICKSQNLLFDFKDKLTVCGKLKAGDYSVKGNISSQFITGLLFALSLLKEDSKIIIKPPFESRSYVNMTLYALKLFGVDIVWENDLTLYIKGGQEYKAHSCQVEGDYSGSVFLDAFNLLGSKVSVTGLNDKSLQGDMIYKKYYNLLNCGTPELDVSDCPDLAPILMTLAACKNGATLTGTRRLKIKESDRGVVMAKELSKFGAVIDVYENKIVIKKAMLHKSDELLCGHNDHRIVMSLAVASSLYGGVISDAEAVNKSFPDFFIKFKALGGKVKYNDNQ